MEDRIIRATAKDGAIRIIGATTTNLVNESIRIHKTTPTASCAMGRMLTAGVLMGAMLKNDKDVLTLKIDGGGPIKGITVTAYADGRVKGIIGNSNVQLPPRKNGTIDVSGAIGKDGMLTVIKDLGLKNPYVGQVKIYTGEVGEDVAYYFTTSEQTPSAVAVGVMFNKDLEASAAGGFIIQMMPDADPLLADLVQYRLEEMSSTTEMIHNGKTIDEIIASVFDDMDLKIHDDGKPYYGCDCSREKIETALISLGKTELANIIADRKDEEIGCSFCGTKYVFTPEEMEQLMEKAK